MEEKDIFDLDDRDLRLPRQYSNPRQVRSGMLIDDSARYLGDAVTKGVTSFDKRMASIQASKDALTTYLTSVSSGKGWKQIASDGSEEDFVPATHATRIWNDLTTLNGG